MDLSELDYALPEALIAQAPLPERDASRLLVLDRDGGITHGRVLELPERISPSLLVVNDTRVFPARLFGQKATGGKVEVLLLERLGPEGRNERWLAMGRSSKGLAPGTSMELAGGAVRGVVEAKRPSGEFELLLRAAEPLAEILERAGEVPLPPYIRRPANLDDRERYQTVFASKPGAVAAPTAGLHLSTRLLERLERAGHRLARVTLHVGPGTFRPVQAERLEAHRMHEERFVVPEETAEAVASARREGRSVLAVGTTVVRTLEATANEDGMIRVGAGATSLFIRPPYRFRVVDALLTNFHLPRSTLLALVMAFGGIEPVRAAYREAVTAEYRFFSYGDAMLIGGATR